MRWSDEDELGDRDNVTGGDKRGGPRRIPGNNTVESKAKNETRSGTHHEHDDGLGAVGDTLEQPGHGEGSRGGVPTGHGEDRLRRAIPANTSDESKSMRSARPMRSR